MRLASYHTIVSSVRLFVSLCLSILVNITHVYIYEVSYTNFIWVNISTSYNYSLLVFRASVVMVCFLSLFGSIFQLVITIVFWFFRASVVMVCFLSL